MTKYEDVELGRYADPSGTTWRIMAAWDDGDCWLECLIGDTWEILCETGSLRGAMEEGLTATEAVKEYVDGWLLRRTNLFQCIAYVDGPIAAADCADETIRRMVELGAIPPDYPMAHASVAAAGTVTGVRALDRGQFVNIESARCAVCGGPLVRVDP